MVSLTLWECCDSSSVFYSYRSSSLQPSASKRSWCQFSPYLGYARVKTRQDATRRVNVRLFGTSLNFLPRSWFLRSTVVHLLTLCC